MAGGKRVNLERLLRSASERQRLLRGAQGQTATMSTESPWPRINSRDLFLAGIALLIEALALLYGVLILTLAAAALLWFALRGFRRERNVAESRVFEVWSVLVLVLITTVLPVGAKKYLEHRQIKNSHTHRDFKITNYARGPLIVGEPVHLDVSYVYSGPDEGVDLELRYEIGVTEFIGNPPPRDLVVKDEDRVWALLLPAMNRPANKVHLPSDAPSYSTLVGPQLTAETVASFQKGRGGTIIYVGQFRYVDSEGDHIREFCGLVQFDATVFVQCDKHNN